MTTFTRRAALIGVGAAAALSMSLPALAQTVTLRFHQMLPPQATIPAKAIVPWIKKVESESGGRLKIQLFNAMQLGQKFGYPLATLGYSVLRDVANELGLPLTQLEAFCLAVDLYMPKNDYHNRLHVADVVQLMHLQCSEGGELNACLTITNLDRHISLT